VDLKEQQIKRYEETEYSAASFSQLKEIIEVLGLDAFLFSYLFGNF